MIHAGVDIGTSGVKIVLVDDDEQVLASASRPIAVSRPQPTWSEQHPDLWWEATLACFDALRADAPETLTRVGAIGLSGQMLGPVLVDAADRPLRPTILWNDGRAVAESEAIAARLPGVGERTGCSPNPGFGAPKLLWLRRHEPEVLDALDCILLPKDYVRLRLTGERATEPTDAAGLHLMEVRTGEWAEDLCAVAEVDPAHLPPVVTPGDPAGRLRGELAERWGMGRGITVAAGTGDNMAGCIGVGVGNPGEAVISIGTSGVMSIVDGTFRPIPDKAVITHGHAAPGTFLSMGVVLAATSCLDWAAALTGRGAAELAQAAETLRATGDPANAPVFLPYVNGIRTPHDRPQARGLMLGLDLSTDVGAIAWSVLEGVAFHVAEGLATQRGRGIDVTHVQFIGGGARSRLWGEMIASLVDVPLDLPVGREVGASLGAARLAMVAAGRGSATAILCRKPPTEARIEPDPALAALLAERYARFEAVQSRVLDLL